MLFKFIIVDRSNSRFPNSGIVHNHFGTEGTDTYK
jgi:hypothetical protein